MTTTDTPTPASLAHRALELPALIEAAEDEVLAEEVQLSRYEMELEELEAFWLTQPDCPIDGKNEATRKAQLYARTHTKHAEIVTAEQARDRARVRLHRLQAEAQAIRTAARLLDRSEA
jgi:hypothetical protein